ncbi:DNA-directed RNA polymerase II subunit RPB4 isoform X2 [Balaenoptera acutorostrata]|uniref:DNA-directed RNA polymerase II subunit RPB4 isoform X2 n=1 Tax=Balaenoptera acutorostrata TaxID=9767 RepID=A0ABM3U0B2_BALAC|nr:DNA-directed RNA polymerase II subunit RPB4 isoform X2 [Balaenoptera acutorostrata]
MAAAGSDPRAGDVEEDASQLIFPKAWRGGLKTRSCSRFSMTSRPSAAFSTDLQAPLLLGGPRHTPARRRWPSIQGCRARKVRCTRHLGSLWTERPSAWSWFRLLFPARLWDAADPRNLGEA